MRWEWSWELRLHYFYDSLAIQVCVWGCDEEYLWSKFLCYDQEVTIHKTLDYSLQGHNSFNGKTRDWVENEEELNLAF